MATTSHLPILLTGAGGYVGGKLWKVMEAQGRRVNCLVRNMGSLQVKMAPTSNVVPGDVHDPESLRKAMEGVGVAYYLVPSLAAGATPAEERQGAQNFAHAAQQVGVSRVVFLGGPRKEGQGGREVVDILHSSGAPTVEIRVSVVIGGGSLSFKLIRALVERFPVLLAPRWTEVEARPLAMADLLGYLAGALDLEVSGHAVFEVGGADPCTYADLIREYARQRGLSRPLLSLPFYGSHLSSLGLALSTPVPRRAAWQLIESLRYPFSVQDGELRQAFGIRPVGYREALAAAIQEGDTA